MLLCNDLKYKQQLKKEQLKFKKKLGNFYEQFGLQPLKEQKSKKSKKFYKNCYKEKTQIFKKKSKSLLKEEKSKPPQFRPRTTQTSWSKIKSSPPICYKYGKVGYFSWNCKIKEKNNNLDESNFLKSIKI